MISDIGEGTRSFKTVFFHFLDPHTGDGEDDGSTIELDREFDLASWYHGTNAAGTELMRRYLAVTTSVQTLSPASRSVTSVTSTARSTR